MCVGSGQTQNAVSFCVCATRVVALDCERITTRFAGPALRGHKFQRPLFYLSPYGFQTKTTLKVRLSVTEAA